MKTAILEMVLIGLIAPAAWSAPDAPMVQVYKSPTCGGCKKWMEHLERSGFEVRARDVASVSAAHRELALNPIGAPDGNTDHA